MHALLDLFERTAAQQAQHPAACDRGMTLSYSGLRALAAGLAPQIARETERKTVGVLLPASALGAAAIFATWYAGKVPVPLNFLLSPEELAGVMHDAELDLVLTIERFAPGVQAAGRRVLALDQNALLPGTGEAPPAGPQDAAVILYTSGTAGVPKGVRLSFNNLVQNAESCITYARIDPDQVFLSVLPQFHSFGFTAMTVTPLLLGATVHYQPRFQPVALLEAIREQRVTVFMAVASMYAALLGMKSATPDAFASLRLTISGGEPLPLQVFDTFKQRFGVTLLEGYGLTETSPAVSLNTPWAHRPGSVGRALPGITVGAVDEFGRDLPAGQTGELVVAGHCVMQGYHNKPVETAAVIRDGRLHTGDVGHVDAEGFIYITGRAKDMMIIGGENVFPGEIEAALLSHPAVAEAAVVSSRDDVRGELPIAFVILRAETCADEAELRSFCRERLAGYKVPREIRFAQDLPRGPTGKILKRVLRV